MSRVLVATSLTARVASGADAVSRAARALASSMRSAWGTTFQTNPISWARSAEMGDYPLTSILAIINDTYSEVKSELATQKNEFEMTDYFKQVSDRVNFSNKQIMRN